MGAIRRWALAATCLCLPALPAQAEPNHTLELTSSGSGYADVTFADPVVLPSEYAPDEYSTLTNGRYVGYAVQRLDGPAPFYVVMNVQHFPWPLGEPGYPTQPGERALPAGRYRFYVPTDGTVSVVRLTMAGLRRDMTVATRPAQIDAKLTRFGDQTAVGRMPFTSDGTTFALGAMVYASHRAGLVQAAVCFRQAATEGCDASSSVPLDPAVPVGGPSGRQRTALPGELAAANWYSVLQVETTPGNEVQGSFFHLAIDTA